MPIGSLDPGTDEFDLAVDYGGYRFPMFFGGGPQCTPLPSTPPPAANYTAGARCGCPHCDSRGWYAQSPNCRFWRADCELCEGTRVWPDFSTGRPAPLLPCDLCTTAWREAMLLFRHALRNPRSAARRLREDAAARARDDDPDAPRSGTCGRSVAAHHSTDPCLRSPEQTTEASEGRRP